MTVTQVTSLTIHLPPELLLAILELSRYNRHSGSNDFEAILSSTLVSRFWNACASALLLRGIRIKAWDSRIKTTLLSALDRNPERYEHIEYFGVRYSRLGSWASTNSPTIRAALAAVETSIGWQKLHFEESKWQLRHQFRCEHMYFPAALSIGAADWQAGGERGDEPRRDGACELMRFASRCPRLRELDLTDFDFGEIERDDLERHKLPILSSVTSLRLHESTCSTSMSLSAQAATRFALLSRLPNLERLDIWVDYYHLRPLTTFQNLHHLTIDGWIEPRGLARLTTFLAESAPNVQKLKLAEYPVRKRLAATLSRLPQLTHLCIESLGVRYNAATINTAHSSLLAYFQTTRLLHISVPYTITPSFLRALPPTLISISLEWSTCNSGVTHITEALEHIITHKPTCTPLLATVVWPDWKNRVGRCEVIAARAKAAGLEVVSKYELHGF